MDWLAENWTKLVLGLGAAGWTAISSPGYLQQARSFLDGQGRQQAVRSEMTEINAAAELLAERAQTAESRYAGGCEIVSTLEDLTLASNIKEGEPLVMGAYAKKFDPQKPNPSYYLGRDLIVCDCYGTTAVTRHDPRLGYAVAKELATTPNRDVMAKACQQRPGMRRPGVSAK